jgi:hypothetical protein
MTSEIIVFQPPEQKEVSLTKSERELLYEDLEKYSPLDSHHFRAFYDMETEDIDSHIVESTIVSIMFKYITDYCFPIIQEIPKLDLRVKRRITRKNLEKEYIEKNFSFTMQFPKKIKGFTKDGDRVILVPNKYYKIIGVKIPKIIEIIKDKTIPDLTSSVHILQLALMGYFGLKNDRTGQYTQQRKYFLHPSPRYKTNLTGKALIFNSNEHAIMVVKKIIEIINEIKDYYATYQYSMHTSLAFNPFLEFRTRMAEKSIKPKNWFATSMETMKETDEIKKIREIYTGILSKYENRFVYSLQNQDVFNIYQKINMLGVNHTKSQDILEELVIKNKNSEIIKLQLKQKSESYLEFAKHQAISFNKFKIKNLEELTPAQKKVVDLEYQNIKKIEEGTKKLAESLQVTSELYKHVDEMDIEAIKKTLKNLKSLLPNISGKIEDKTSIIKDKNDVAAVCPHILKKAERLVESEKDPVKISQVREHIIKWFSLPDVSLGYFCKICGALLAEQDEEKLVQFLNGNRVNYIPGIDPRQSIVWKEVAYIVSTFVKFKEAVDLKKIITTIANSIKDEISTVENKLSKIKTNNNDSIRDMLRVYISIYTYAIIIHMIFLNYGKITFITKESKRGGSELSPYVVGKRRKVEVLGMEFCDDDDEQNDADYEDESPFIKKALLGGEQKKVLRVKRMTKLEDKKRLQNIFKVALELIIKSKNALLNKLSNISIDNIKPLLIEAYKWVVSLKTSVNAENTVRKHNTAYFLSIDPLYEYIWYVHALKNFSQKKKMPLLSDIKLFLGRSLSQIEEDYEKGKTIYETAQSVEPWGKTEHAKTMHGSFMFVFEYVKNKLYTQNVVPMNESISSYVKRYAYLKDLSDSIYQKTIMQRIHPLLDYPIDPKNNIIIKYNNFSASNINTADHYCSDGKKHNFSIFVFHKASHAGIIDSKKPMEVTADDMKKWLVKDAKKVEEFKSYHFVDEKCSNCQVYLSKIKKDKTLDDKLDKIDTFKAFYDYFENRCPEGDLHNFNIDARKDIEDCSKCGFTRSLFLSLDKKYYDKHLEKYKQIVADQKLIDQKSIYEFKKITKEFDIKLKKYPAWVIDNKPVLTLSRATGIKYNILINLGLSEGRKFENIEKEKENPHINSTDAEDILRNQYLRDYGLWVLRLYYLMKNYNIVLNIPHDLKEMIETHRSKKKMTKYFNFPEIYDEFNEKYNYYFRTLKPKFISNFLLNYICNIFLKILETVKNTDYDELGKDFVDYCLKSIIKSEKDVSKPPPLSLIIDKGSDKTAVSTNLVADDEYYNFSESDDMGKDLDELVEDSEGDDFSRHDLDLDLSSGLDEEIEGNAYDQ